MKRIHWKDAAPNLGDDGILEWATYSPLDITRRIPNMVSADWIGGLIDLVDYRPAFLAHAGLLVPGGRAASVCGDDCRALRHRGSRPSG